MCEKFEWRFYYYKVEWTRLWGEESLGQICDGSIRFGRIQNRIASFVTSDETSQSKRCNSEGIGFDLQNHRRKYALVVRRWGYFVDYQSDYRLLWRFCKLYLFEWNYASGLLHFADSSFRYHRYDQAERGNQCGRTEIRSLRIWVRSDRLKIEMLSCFQTFKLFKLFLFRYFRNKKKTFTFVILFFKI